MTMELKDGCCPLAVTTAFVRMCLAQSCGKCVPCRVGLDRLAKMLEAVLDGEDAYSFSLVQETARSIYESADCAVGFEAAKAVLDNLDALKDDFESHFAKRLCTARFASVPCQSGCPAHVNIPGYIACIGAGRYADAVRVIREDNPFPSACGLICEHPCERPCRRNLVDDAINIRGLKRYAVEKAGVVPPPPCAPRNGRRIGIVGGGPAGMTAAYFLALRGFEVTVFEKREKLGGMLRYGIPAYRLPDADLDRDLDAILATGVKVSCGVSVGEDVPFAEFRGKFDAVYVSIGAHGAKKLGIEGEDAEGVLSAVELLRKPGNFDFTGRRVVVVGGGNVAMDATRTARRLGAESVQCVYRRRLVDMTALPDEIAGAQAEGCEVVPLMAPVRVAVGNGRAVGLVVQPQLAGPVRKGRPAPINASVPEVTIPCDVVVAAIGQRVDATGIDLADEALFVGGDCQTGPATVIRAIAAGKSAALDIAASLRVSDAPNASNRLAVPDASAFPRLHWGRVSMTERPASERQRDFELMERGMTDEEARQECSRCLRCDRCGYGAFRKV